MNSTDRCKSFIANYLTGPGPACKKDLNCSKSAHLHSGCGQHELYKAEVITRMKSGQIAFQIMALDDSITLSCGESCPLFTTDPWLLYTQSQHNSAPASGKAERIHGLPMGIRALLQLVAQVRPAPLAADTFVTHLLTSLSIMSSAFLLSGKTTCPLQWVRPANRSPPALHYGCQALRSCSTSKSRLDTLHSPVNCLMYHLRLQTEALAGHEAVLRLVVVLHVSEAIEAEVMTELKKYKLCG